MLTRYAMIAALMLIVYGCDGSEKKIVALEQRVSAAETKIKKLEALAGPATTTAQEHASSTADESGVAKQSEQVLTNTQSTPQSPPVATASTSLPTQNLSGVGKQATQLLTLQEGLYVFRFTHSGTNNFIVHLLDSDGRRVESLVNVIGGFSGSKAVRISKPGQYILDIDADGAWTIVAGPP
jgi:hypothetical protein